MLWGDPVEAGAEAIGVRPRIVLARRTAALRPIVLEEAAQGARVSAVRVIRGVPAGTEVRSDIITGGLHIVGGTHPLGRVSAADFSAFVG